MIRNIFKFKRFRDLVFISKASDANRFHNKPWIYIQDEKDGIII